MEGLIEGAVLAVLRAPVPPRHPCDGDFRDCDTAVGHSRLLFHEPDGNHPQFHVDDGDGLVAGVLVDDAIVEIENIVRHMRMGKSGYQAALDAADEIGLAVLATTMAIVAVFLPVALMPGIAGQYFKAFGFTVVLSVLMSLFVARMITPLIAAYFLRSHGDQPHAAWKWMDVYLKILNWSLDTSKAHALLERLPRSPRRFGYYAIAASAPAACHRRLRRGHGRDDAASASSAWRRHRLRRSRALSARRRYVSARLIALPRATGRRRSFADWHGIIAARWNARMHDHRLAMVGAGVATLLLSVVLFGTLLDVLLPAAEQRFLARQHHPASGHHAEADGGGGRPRRGDHRSGIRTSNACSSA